MRKIALALVLLIWLLGLPGCDMPTQYSVENIQNITVAGLDIDGENIILTVVVDTMQKGDSPDSQKIGTKVYKAQGRTVFEAKRALHEFTDKHISWDQLLNIIVGEEAAIKGVDQVLYFFCENEENKFIHKLLVSKGQTAAEFIETADSQEEISLSDLLESLSKEAAQTAATSDVTLIDFLRKRSCDSECLMIPTVYLIQNSAGSGQTGAQQPFLIKKAGFAIFNEDHLAGYLNDESARALNIVLNEIKSTDFVVKDWHDQNTSLELIKSTAKIKPDFDTLSAQIEVDMKLNLVEYFEGQDVFKEGFVITLENNVNEQVKREISNMIDTLQRKDSDVVLLGNAFYHENPEKWQNIKEDWLDIFPDIPVTVKVTSTIQCSYNLQSATGR